MTHFLRSPAVVAALVAATTGCVITTYEGPAEPPRVVVPPPTVSDAPPLEATEQASLENLDETDPEQPTVLVRHLLVMHAQSMRVPQGITRSREEARQRAKEALERAQAGEEFGELVAEYSDEPGAAERGGLLPRFGKTGMVKEFTDAAFALEPGQLSGLVETPFGFHIIERLE